MSQSLTAHLRRTAVTLAAAAACASASAQLPQFSLAPGAIGLNGASFTGDNVLISDYSTIRLDGAGGFTDSGFLSVSAIQLGGNTFTPTGLNSTYGLYFAFSGAGTTSLGNPSTTNTSGNFSSLDFTLYGYNGTASFGFDASNNPTTTAPTTTVLATGSLVPGTGSVSTMVGAGKFVPTAAATLTFQTAAASNAFFSDPTPFYDLAFAAFTNTTSQVTPFVGGFRIEQGGGAFNFAATPPIPEPETYALMLAGLAAVGFVARRRRT